MELALLEDEATVRPFGKGVPSMTKYKVSLTLEERTALERLVSVGKTAARKLTHARILLLADSATEERTDQEIVATLGVSAPTISRVRQRFVTEGIDAAINHRPQPPRPDKVKIKGDVEQELVRLACAEPPPGRCRWTLCLLANELVVLGLLPSVGRETVRRALKKMTSAPGSSRSGASHRGPMLRLSAGWRM
jgi:transposase